MFLGTLGGASQKNPNAQGTAGLQGAEEALNKAKETSGFTNLKAVKDDHVILVDGSKWTSTGAATARGHYRRRQEGASALNAPL